jgi:PAS domain S-box-containing protein
MIPEGDNMSQQPLSMAEMEQKIKELEQKLEQDETLLDLLPIMFWYKDKENRHIRLNRRAAQLEGLPVTAFEGKTAEELYPPELAAAYHKDDLEVIESGLPKLGIIERHRKAEGEDVWLETGKIPYRDLSGRIIGVIAFAIDVSAQQRIQETMRLALKEIREALERKADPEEILTYLKDVEKKLDGSRQ